MVRFCGNLWIAYLVSTIRTVRSQSAIFVASLARELDEELAVSASIGDEVFTTTHAYPERRVELHFFRCDLLGEPQPQIGQDMRWVSRADLAVLAFPPADAELIEMLRRSG